VRVTRIRLQNYRGIKDREVTLAPCGVTIIEGPNECGKSSLAEALDVVLNEKETSAKKNVRALKRTDLDVPTEVEVDIETGPYRFTLHKAFNKRSRAELTIHAPKAEILTGGEVHGRIREILAESVDTRLLDALWVQQGAKIEQTSLAGCTSLAEALDHAAGTVPAGDREETLLASAAKEFARYWTPSGGEGREMASSARRVQEARAHFDAAVEEDTRLRTDVEVSERLQRELVELELEEQRESGSAEEWLIRLGEVEQIEGKIKELDASRRMAELEWTAAKKDQVAREVMIRDLDEAITKATAAEAALAQFEERLNPLAAQSRALDVDRDQLHAALTEARALLDLRAHDRQHMDDLAELEVTRERGERIERSAREKATAAATLERITVDTKVIEELRTLMNRVQAEKAKLEALSASAVVEAHRAISVTVDGDLFSLEAGERLTRIVSQASIFNVVGLVAVTVGPGTSVDEQRGVLSDAERLLQDALGGVGAATMEEAEVLLHRRDEALRAVSMAQKQMELDLRDLTASGLREAIGRLEAKTQSYASNRQAQPALAGDAEHARRLEAQAREAYERLDERYSLSRASAKSAQEEYQTAVVEKVALDTDHRVATKEAERLADRLERERAVASDAQVTKHAADRCAAHDTAAEALRTSKERLEGRDPAATRLRTENAKQVLRQVRSQLFEKRTDFARVQAAIDALSPKGLFSRCQETEAALRSAEEIDQRLRQRAVAAKLLLQTLRAERTDAQKAYVEPLRREIEERGRAVFGSDFMIELDEARLAVVRRRLQGVWVSWDQLSVGAQEQLGILTRLAAASLVSMDGGAPLIIDDALGHSDDERLDAMCAVLGAAGGAVQIIALTCTPGRYRRIGGATTISMVDRPPDGGLGPHEPRGSL
jgi:hypothetical protein